MALVLMLAGCSAGRGNPFVRPPQISDERWIQAMALNYVLANHVPAEGAPTPWARCVGVARLGVFVSPRWVLEVPRDRDLDPQGAFLRALEVPDDLPLLPLSSCRHEGDFGEVDLEQEQPVVTFFVTAPRFAATDRARLSVTVLGEGRWSTRYGFEFRRRGTEWMIHRQWCFRGSTYCRHVPSDYPGRLPD
ncbi:MAG: hypothetical protein D6701_10420 [Gemmatimonadetes bacterium]|nr:MAG: hypothetical protein D6701_10420 [Gemmatimonadota bacterium]